ncbi:MAG: hypothetical protein IJW90_05650 [Clostridia bacterium]|nr:hypothetical protein [Clostridia bacterium]
MEKHEKTPSELDREAHRMIQVEDEAGHRYEATYPKRAKGLIKNGRARFKDESQTTIILTCPPKHHNDLEDTTMNEHIQHTESTAVETNAVETVTVEATPALSAKEVFDQIVSLQNLISGDYTNPLHFLSATVNSICCENQWESDQLKCGAINAASTPYRIREETYQQMLAIYQQMYNDLTSPEEARCAERKEFMNWVRDCIDATQCGQDLPDFEKLWKMFS